jgi:hypothetical protein
MLVSREACRPSRAAKTGLPPVIFLPHLFLGLSLAIQPPTSQLVLELGSPDFRTREAATRQLQQ